ncbi:copper chaperone PCu(A)C [Rhodobacteraceae bacterium NNCM2]|nr:copper chaperone PCu(A)C [Coraliihabitans acroporae]
MKPWKIVLGLLAVAALGFALWPGKSHDIILTDVTAAPLGQGGAAVFMTIDNRGAPDRLIGAASPAGEMVLESPEAEGGPPVPTGQASLAADGAHLRLTGLAATPGDGALIPLTLVFERAGEITAKARLVDPASRGAAGEVGLFGLGDICRVGEGEPAPQISLTARPDGEGWEIHVEAEEFTFSEELAGLYHVPGVGHGHLYVGGLKMGRLYAPEARIGALPPGRHVVRVTLNTNDHRAYVVEDVPVTATAVIEVD